jgi:periplasmic protein CpxP/Spy
MKKILGVLILGLLAMATFSMQAVAEDKASCPGMTMGMHGKMMGAMQGGMEKKIDLNGMFSHKARFIMENAIELGLSDDQMQKIKLLKMNIKKSMIKSDADVEILVLDIEAALGKEEIDVNSVSTLIDKKYSIKLQEAKTLVSAYADLKKVLSKDQMKKLHEIWNKQKMAERKPMMMEGKKEPERKMGMR